MSAGYSGTPLTTKLGISEGASAAFVNAPGHFADLLGELPAGVTVRTDARSRVDLAVYFVTARRTLEQRLPALRRIIEPDGMLWVAWPKRASGVATDMTEDVVRAVTLPTGLVDTKVCAIDETWSGLRLVVRRELR